MTFKEFKNAQERYEDTKITQALIEQEKERVLSEFWQGELGEFLINEIEKEITSMSEQGLFETQISFNSMWNNLGALFPNRMLPESEPVMYDVIAMYEDKGFEVKILDGLMPRLVIKWDSIEDEKRLGLRYDLELTSTKRRNNMEFDNYTIEKLKRILEELDFETDGYEWGTDEHEFLMSLCGEIEDVLRG